jgi:hypothetical protein
VQLDALNRFGLLRAWNRFRLLRPDAACQDSEYNANGCAQDSMHGGLCSTSSRASVAHDAVKLG